VVLVTSLDSALFFHAHGDITCQFSIYFSLYVRLGTPSLKESEVKYCFIALSIKHIWNRKELDFTSSSNLTSFSVDALTKA
jgi:hypothetical protein